MNTTAPATLRAGTPSTRRRYAIVLLVALCAVGLFLIAMASANTALFAQHYPMLQRNLLYTGVTRGKKLVVLVGQKKAVAIAVRNATGRRRWSKLREWLRDQRSGVRDEYKPLC